MSKMNVITNNQYRQTLLWNDLTKKQQKEFDYLKTEEEQQEASFVKYRGWVYNISEFMRVEPNNSLKAWHGYTSDTYFSGVLIKIDDEGDVCMGRYYS